MRRIVSLAMTFLLVFSFVAVLQVPSIAAQETGALGTPVLITDAAGEPLIEMSVDSFTPDFTGYDNSYAPDRGFVYGLATITVTNVGTSPYALNTYSFMLIDTDGFMSQAAFAMVDTAQAPDAFDYDAIEPGDSVTGSVLFSMLAGTSAAASCRPAIRASSTLSSKNRTASWPASCRGTTRCCCWHGRSRPRWQPATPWSSSRRNTRR